MTSPSEVIVLAEDSRHQRFVYRYLLRLGFSRRQIRFFPLPAGRGSGEKWVREKYSENVIAYRLRAAKAKTALVVVLDVDVHSVSHRSTQLAGALRTASVPARNSDELIAHLLPKRSIETWILCLTAARVDEGTDYRHSLEIDENVLQAALALFEWTRPNTTLPNHCLESIELAVPELRRIEK